MTFAPEMPLYGQLYMTNDAMESYWGCEDKFEYSIAKTSTTSPDRALLSRCD